MFYVYTESILCYLDDIYPFIQIIPVLLEEQGALVCFS